VPTECSETLFEFALVEGRQVVAGFLGKLFADSAYAGRVFHDGPSIRLMLRKLCNPS
jgi:hypothetical protein